MSGFPGHRQERRQPVVVLDDFVGYGIRSDLSRPSHHQRNSESAFPICIFLAAERGHGAIGPGVHVRAVVGRVQDQRVVRNPQFVQQIEQLTDILIVVDHRIVVGRLPPAGLPQAFGFGVREQVHVGRVDPTEERLSRRRPGAG